MGQTLSEPVTAKDTTTVRNSTYRVGSSCMQGWRINMEDAHTHILSIPDDPGTAFFGVYDGHGGAKTSDYAGKHLHKFIIKRPEYQSGNIPLAMRRAFLEMDQIMFEEESLKVEQSGSTAVIVVIKDNRLYCANIGDSRAIGCKGGQLVKLSYDHKPNNPEEYERITDAGGWVDCNRVNGNLALSRAFGDYIFKRDSTRAPEEQIVTALPDIVEKDLSEDWDFIVLACDGIWDVMTDDDVLNFVAESISNGLEPEEICENLMMRCLAPDCQMAGLGCDNMTVVIVVFLHGKTYEDMVERCKTFLTDHRIQQIEVEQRSTSFEDVQESIDEATKVLNEAKDILLKNDDSNDVEKKEETQEKEHTEDKSSECASRCRANQFAKQDE